MPYGILMPMAGAITAICLGRDQTSNGLINDLRIPLEEIVSATNNFDGRNLIHRDEFAKFYKGQLLLSGQLVDIVVQRIDGMHKLSEDEFPWEILKLFRLEHKNLLSIVGFCDENDENIIINEHMVIRSSLVKHLSDSTLRWTQRLRICIGAAHALRYSHYNSSRVGGYIYGSIKSSTILLDSDWEAKVCLTTASGLRHHSDNFAQNVVYPLGVVLLEVLCERKLAMIGDGGGGNEDLAHYKAGELEKMINPNMRIQMRRESLTIFSEIACNCLNRITYEARGWNRFYEERDKMDRIVQELEELLELQMEHENILEPLKIQLSDIVSATSNFAKEYRIGSGAYGIVYKAELDHHGTVAIKRISNKEDQGEQGFFIEIEMLGRCEHPNIISLLGFCHEGPEMILVYEYAFKRSLNDYLGSTDKTTNLTWAQRIRICLDVANGLNYLHKNTQDKPKIIHRDIKSANILLGEKWNAKIADFGLSKFHPMDQDASTINTNNIAGTSVYLDPEYLETGKLKKESDIYSFGVVLFEILSGRLAYDPIYLAESDKGLAPIARRCFNEGTLKEMVDPQMKEADELISTLSKGPNQDSLDTFSKIAYQCLAETQVERPTIEVIIEELRNALNFQENRKDTIKISLEDIKLGTENFSDNTCIIRGAFGKAYKGEVQYDNGFKTIVAKRLSKYCQEDYFLIELEILSKHKHKNVIGLLGYCKEMNEKIIVYEDASNGSLDMHLNNVILGWTERLKICIDVASGLDFLHGGVLRQEVVIHRDIKSASILLNGDWNAKISDFGHSLIAPINKEMDTVINDVVGTHGYDDPSYWEMKFLSKESDIYSFGVVLFEILCGRLTMDIWNDKGFYLDKFVKECIEQQRLDEIVFYGIKQQIAPQSLITFQKIAYQCLHHRRHKRPSASEVVVQLKKALEFQEEYEIWERKLPKDYKEIFHMSKSPKIYFTKTKKELYNMLSKGILLQEGRVWFSLGNDGERIKMISARMFSYKNNRSRERRHIQESRFQKVVEMLDISNLKIQIKIRAQSLSPGINYRVYIVFKFCGQRKSVAKRMYVNLKYKKGSENDLHSYFATWREDGWMMIQLCGFSTQKGDIDYEVLLESLSPCYTGSGAAIYIEGIQFQAINNVKHKEIKKSKEVPQMDMSQQLPNYSEETFKRFENYEEPEKYSFPSKEVSYDSSSVKLFHLIQSTHSRFEEEIKLLPRQVFHIKCRIGSHMLSPSTDYACYLVFKLSENCRGLHCPVKVRDQLHWKNKETKILFFRSPNPLDQHDANWVPEQREDGLMEVNVWTFNSNDDLRNNFIPMNLKLIAYEGTMSGLIVYGFEVRPM